MSESRKTIYVNVKLQRMIILSMAMCAVVGGGITFFAQYFFFRSFENKGFEMGLSPEHLFFRFIEQQASLMNWIVVSLIIAFAFAFGYVGLKLSHRIAGPLFRLEQNMNDLAEGRSVEELTFREGDFFQPLAQSFNKMRKTNR